MDTWLRAGFAVFSAVGELAETKLVGLPFSSYVKASEYPALLIEPSGSIEEDCAKGDVEADQLR